MAVFTMENSYSRQNWEFEHSSEIRVNIEIERKWQSKDLSVRVSHRLWTRKVIFCPVLIFLYWSGEGPRQTVVKAVFFTLIISAVGPMLKNNSGRDRLWHRRTKAWMGTMRFLVLFPLKLISPDTERTSFQFMNGISSAVLLKFLVSLALLTSMNFKYHADLEPFLRLLLRLTISLWITL